MWYVSVLPIFGYSSSLVVIKDRILLKFFFCFFDVLNFAGKPMECYNNFRKNVFLVW